MIKRSSELLAVGSIMLSISYLRKLVFLLSINRLANQRTEIKSFPDHQNRIECNDSRQTIPLKFGENNLKVINEKPREAKLVTRCVLEK